MKVIRILFLTGILLTINNFRSAAQNTEPKPLDSVLLLLQKRYDIIFTYADETIRNISAHLPSKNLSLDECLLNLEKQTKLKFKKLDARYVAIQHFSDEITITGTIFNSYTKKPVEEAFIYSGNKYAVSNVNGQFSLKVSPQKDSVLMISHTAYRPFKLKIIDRNKATYTIELIPKIQVIKEVLVPYLIEGIGKLRDGSIQLNVNEVEILPGMSETDILHTVQVLPGIQSTNETASDINTRGGTNDQSLILWEDVKMYQTGHFFGLISAINSHLINKACIIKNGTSAAYDGSVSGTIDMQLQDYQVNKFETSIGLNMIGADAIVKAPLTKKLSLILEGGHSINEMVITPTYEKYYERAFKQNLLMQNQTANDTVVDQQHNFTFYDLSGKLIFDITEKDKLSLSALNIYNSLEYKKTTTIHDTIYNRESNVNQSSLLSNASYSHFWSEKHSIKLSAFVSHYLLEGRNISESENFGHLQANEVLDWGVKVKSKNSLSSNITLSSGYQFKETGIRNEDNLRSPGYRRNEKEVLRIHSLYTEAELKGLLDKIYLRAGLRANYFTKFKEVSIEPRFVFNYALSKHISLEVLAEMKNQHTTQLIDFQTDFLGIEKRRWVLANNASVPLIKSHQLSVGLQYSLDEFLFLLEGYVKRVNGIITPSQGFQNQFQYVYSIGEYNANGIEILANKHFKQLNIWTNYTLAQNNYFFQNLTPSTFPNNLDIRHTLSLGGSYSFNSFVISGGLSYKTGKPYTQPDESNTTVLNEIVYQSPNSSRIKDYMRLDLSAKYNFTVKKVKGEVGVSVWNLLNRKNDINVYYQLTDNDQIEQITQHALGITPNVNLRVRF